MSHLTLALFATGFVLAAQTPSLAPAPIITEIVIHSEGVAPTQQNFQGSVPAARSAGSLKLSLQDAIARGLKNNLGILLLDSGTKMAQSQRIRALTALLPNVAVSISENADQLDLSIYGFRFPGVPRVVGPYEYIDARALVTQSLFDWTAIKNHQSAIQEEKAAGLSLQDGRDLVVQAVASAYLQIVADSARIETTRAQVSTAEALYQRAREQHSAGTSPAIDELRAHVQLKTRQLDLLTQINRRNKDKLALGRMIGLAPEQEFEATDPEPYAPLSGLTIESALDQAYKARTDYQSVAMQVHAAETARMAAEGERLPTVKVAGSYGAVGQNPGNAHGTFSAAASLTVNVFDGGRSRADIERTDAVIKSRKDQLADLRGLIDVQIRTAFLDLQTAAEQVTVAGENLNLAEETLVQARTRFVAGVADNIEVVQAQDALAGANASAISAVLVHNLAKVSLARAIGTSEVTLKQYLEHK
jgi:outer membrane protein TolC